MSAVGIDNPIAHLAGDMVSYVNPVTGAISSGIDAYEAAKKGNWGEAAVNTLFAIPFIGGAAKGVACRKRHTLNAFAVHIVHRITTAAAHADDLNDCQVLGSKIDGHVSTLLFVCRFSCVFEEIAYNQLAILHDG